VPELGSGIPCGVYGGVANGELRWLGMSFTKRVIKRELDIISLVDPKTTSRVVTVNLGDNGFMTIDNRQASQTSLTNVQKRAERTYSDSYESQNSFAFTSGLEISYSQSFGVEGVSQTQFGLTASVGFERTETLTTSRSFSDTEEFIVGTTYAW
jgi:hypothetical protein